METVGRGRRRQHKTHTKALRSLLTQFLVDAGRLGVLRRDTVGATHTDVPPLVPSLQALASSFEWVKKQSTNPDANSLVPFAATLSGCLQRRTELCALNCSLHNDNRPLLRRAGDRFLSPQDQKNKNGCRRQAEATAS